MFRSGIGYALALALLGGALVHGQGSGPAGDPLESRVGKVITVTEVGRSPEKCVIVQVWRMTDGSPAMQAKSLTSGEMLSIVETSQPDASGTRFRVYRWGPQGIPPAGTPVPPSFGQAAPSPSRLGDGRPGEKPVIASSRPALKPIQATSSPTESSAVQRAAYLPSATESKPSSDSAGLVPGTVKETVERPGPVIVGQPNVPVQLMSDTGGLTPSARQVEQVSASSTGGLTPSARQVEQVSASSTGGLTPSARQVETPAARQDEPVSARQVETHAAGCCVCEPSKIILVTEPGRPTQKCEIVGVSPHGLGGKALHVKNLETGECFTIVEGGLHRVGNVFSRFCLLRGKMPCPVICSTCESCPPTKTHPAPASEPLPAPKTAQPSAMPFVKPTEPVAASGTSKFATSLLPPEEGMVTTNKDPAVTKSPAELPPPAEPPVTETDSQGGVNRLFSKLWSMASEREAKGKSDKSKAETLPKPSPAEDKTAKKEPKEEKLKADEKKKSDGDLPVSVKPSAKPSVAEAKAGPAEQVPVPVPLVPLATTEPRPIAPPPQPPVKPFNTMTSSAMNQMPQMSPTKAQDEPMTAVTPPPAVTGVPMPGGVVTSTVWSRGPVAPVSQPPAVATVSRTSSVIEPMSMETTVQMLQVLHTSGVPSQREFAATRLRACDPSVQPYVVEALITAIRSDSAPLVRIAAIQSLAAMKAKSKPVLAALEAACKDRDPRVRDEAEQAVQTLKADDEVKTADYRSK